MATFPSMKLIDEQLFADTLIRLLSLPLVAEPLPPGDGPDFALHGALVDVGLEVTRVYRPKKEGKIPRQQMEGIRRSILSDSARMWNDAGYPAISAVCHFNHNRTPFSKDVAEVVTQLVQRATGALEGRATWDLLTISRPEDRGLPPAVHTLHLRLLPPGSPTRWQAADSEWRATLSAGTLQLCIDRKNAKLRQYSTPGRELWLLLAMDSRSHSGAMTVPAEVLSHVYLTGFSKVYLLDYIERTVWQLFTESPIG